MPVLRSHGAKKPLGNKVHMYGGNQGHSGNLGNERHVHGGNQGKPEKFLLGIILNVPRQRWVTLLVPNISVSSIINT